MNTLISPTISNYTQYSTSNYSTSFKDKVANNMPNGIIKVAEPQNTKNLSNNIKNTDLRQVYTPRLAPSSGSLTVSFLKSRSNMSPIYRFNEAATKYEMTSVSPIFLKQIKKTIDLII